MIPQDGGVHNFKWPKKWKEEEENWPTPEKEMKFIPTTKMFDKRGICYYIDEIKFGRTVNKLDRFLFKLFGINYLFWAGKKGKDEQ